MYMNMRDHPNLHLDTN